MARKRSGALVEELVRRLGASKGKKSEKGKKEET